MQNEQATSTVIVNGEQAKQEMTALEQRARSLKEQLIQANKAGDGKAYDKLSRDLKKTQKEMKQLNKESFDVKRILDNLSGSSLKDLEAAQRRLNAQLKSGDVKRNSREWRENVEAQKKVKTEIRAINNEMRVGESRMSRFANGFNKYFSSIAAGFAALAGITMSLKKYRDNSVELEDTQKNLQALTGLSVEDIAWLSNEAKILSTKLTKSGVRIRQSSKEIIDAYTLVGSAKPELLENKEALKEVTEQTLILATASKMDLKDAVNGVTMAMNQYSARAEEAGRHTNVLAAGSKLGAANVESITASVLKSGVAAAQANIPIEGLVATIETLAEKGIKDEIAGTGLKKFFLTLQTGADDTNPKIVGLETALDNLSKKQMSAAEIKKMFGEEGYNVAAVLMNETERVKYFTEAVTDTSIALEQATINSDSMAAKIAQAKNRLNEAGMEFVSRLNPAILQATNFSTKFIKMLVQMPKFLKENWIILSSLVLIWVSYSVAVNAAIIKDKSKIFWTDKLTVSIKRLWLALKANPWGAILTAITLATYGIVKWIGYQAPAEKAMSDFNKEAYKQQTELNNIFDAYKKANKGSAEKARLLKVILDKYKPYIQDLVNEKGQITDIEAAQKLANKALREQIALKMQNSLLNDMTTKEVEIQADILQKLRDRIISKKGESIGNIIVNEITDIFKNNTENLVDASEDAMKVLDKYDLRDNVISRRQMSESVGSLFSSFFRLESGTKKIKSNFESLIGDAQKFSSMLEDGESTQDSNFQEALKRRETLYKREMLLLRELLRQKTISERTFQIASEQEELAFLEQKFKLQQQFGEDTIDTELEISMAKYKIMQNDEKRLADHQKARENLLKLPGKEVTEEDPIIDITKYTLATRLAIIEEFYKRGLYSEREYLEKIAILYKANQKEINKTLRDEALKRNQDDFEAGIIGHKQYLQRAKIITGQYWEETFAGQHDISEKILDVAKKASDLIQSLAEAETIAVENKYAKQLEAARKAGEDTTALEEQIEEEKKQVKKKYADIDFAITVAKIIAETALAIMEAAPNIPLQIITGAAGLAQIAIADQQRQAVQNLWTGGFTSPGGKYEPRGIVHAGEFVANQDAVNNSELRQLFNLIDYAQKTNTVARIDKRLITETLSAGSGFAKGGFTTPMASSPSAPSKNDDYNELVSLLNENKSLLLMLYSLLSKGIKAHTYVAGKGGIEEANELYSQINKNAKRL